MGFIVISITHPNKKHAHRICRELLEKKLIACANLFPIQSTYWWKEEIVESKEWVSIVKTATENWETVKKTVEEMHEYEVPCIERILADANESYSRWIIDDTLRYSGK